MGNISVLCNVPRVISQSTCEIFSTSTIRHRYGESPSSREWSLNHYLRGREEPVRMKPHSGQSVQSADTSNPSRCVRNCDIVKSHRKFPARLLIVGIHKLRQVDLNFQLNSVDVTVLCNPDRRADGQC